jgi:hypothetical protein
MAKRFNVSIPDALAERLEPYKNQISLSALMQAAIERELAQLTRPEIDKDLRASFKAAAINAWIERNYPINDAISAFVEHLLQRGLKDSLSDFSRIYRLLYIQLRKDELRIKLMHEPRYMLLRMNSELSSEDFEALTPKDPAERALEYALSGNEGAVADDFICFIKTSLKADPTFLPAHLWSLVDGEVWLSEALEVAIGHAPTISEIMLEMMDSRVREIMSNKDIDNYLLDFESAFGMWEENW